MSAPTTYCELEERQKYIEKNNNGISWYLSFKNPDESCTKKIDNCKQEKLDEKCDCKNKESK